jgi:uncharacterized membrane protein YesL
LYIRLICLQISVGVVAVDAAAAFKGSAHTRSSKLSVSANILLIIVHTSFPLYLRSKNRIAGIIIPLIPKKSSVFLFFPPLYPLLPNYERAICSFWMTKQKIYATMAAACMKYGEAMNKIFDPQNSFWQWIGRAPYILILSILWFVMCIPIVTIVPATIALYDAVARNLRPDEKGLFRRYFRTFVKELGRGIILSIIWAVIAYLLTYSFQILEFNALTDPNYDTWTLVFQVTLMIPVGVFLWMVTLESRFVYSFFNLIKNSLTFFFAYLPQTLLMVILFIVGILACWFYIPLIFFMPALLMLLLSFPVESVFRKCMEEQAAAQAPAETDPQ